MIIRAAIVLSLLLACAVPSFAQGRQGGGGRQGGAGRPAENLGAPPPPPTAGKPAPAPRTAEGRVTLNGGRDGKGIWMPVFPFGGHLTPLDQVPFQPWARKVYDERLAHQFEPHSRCKASGGTRQMQTPYGVEIVEVPELQQLLIFDIGGPHSYRVVYMDGRSHPARLEPTWHGHSIGWWEGDTLVVDTTGYNEAFWVDRRGLPSTEHLRTTERLTRSVFDTILYEVTIDDPGAYTRPFSGKFELRLDPGNSLFEYMCQEANYAAELMVGNLESVERTTSIVP